MADTPLQSPTEAPSGWRPLLIDLAILLVINTVFAVAWYKLGTEHSGDFTESLIYSHAIGFCCFGGAMLAKHLLPNRRQRLPVVLLTLPFSVVAGLALGGLFSGNGAGNTLRWAGQHPEINAIFSLSCAFIGFLIMWSRDRAARRRAELEARAAKAEAEQRDAARALAEAELAALQAQIEPHFLFNTLANMRSLITRDPVLAQQLLDRLITYLRSTLQTARAKETTLGREFELLDSYLDIQRIRMGGRFQYRMELPDTLRHRPCPPMLLQPLVENAIRHGIEPKVGNAALCLRAHEQDNGLVLEVEDDGVGFGVANTGGTGVGLDNLRARLLTLHGNAARLLIEEPTGGGVRVRIELPGVSA